MGRHLCQHDSILSCCELARGLGQEDVQGALEDIGRMAQLGQRWRQVAADCIAAHAVVVDCLAGIACAQQVFQILKQFEGIFDTCLLHQGGPGLPNEVVLSSGTAVEKCPTVAMLFNSSAEHHCPILRRERLRNISLRWRVCNFWSRMCLTTLFTSQPELASSLLTAASASICAYRQPYVLCMSTRASSALPAFFFMASLDLASCTCLTLQVAGKVSWIWRTWTDNLFVIIHDDDDDLDDDTTIAERQNVAVPQHCCCCWWWQHIEMAHNSTSSTAPPHHYAFEIRFVFIRMDTTHGQWLWQTSSSYFASVMSTNVSGKRQIGRQIQNVFPFVLVAPVSGDHVCPMNVAELPPPPPPSGQTHTPTATATSTPARTALARWRRQLIYKSNMFEASLPRRRHVKFNEKFDCHRRLEHNIPWNVKNLIASVSIVVYFTCQ